MVFSFLRGSCPGVPSLFAYTEIPPEPEIFHNFLLSCIREIPSGLYGSSEILRMSGRFFPVVPGPGVKHCTGCAGRNTPGISSGTITGKIGKLSRISFKPFLGSFLEKIYRLSSSDSGRDTD